MTENSYGSVEECLKRTDISGDMRKWLTEHKCDEHGEHCNSHALHIYLSSASACTCGAAWPRNEA